jgi:apolipoprotein D and lipocalin family protein
VLDRAEDYSWSIVGEPSGRYLWILARQAHLPDKQKEMLISKVEALGYDTKMLYFPKHP